MTTTSASIAEALRETLRATEEPTEPRPPAVEATETLAAAAEAASSSTTASALLPPPAPLLRLLPGLTGCRSVDNFERLNKIDEGTYGVVYRARDKQTGEVVALKKLKMDREREGFPLTSLREIKILMALKHPNIVDVKEIVVGNSLDSIFIVMEFLEHELRYLMGELPANFSTAEVKCLLQQLLQGVLHLHENWVLHRDLKTSNLLLNNRGVLKVADFGLAREYGSPLKAYTPAVVTQWYRPPELLLGAKVYSTAVDMWSVGCIFAELLTREPLLPGRSDLDQIDRIFKLLGTANDKIWPEFSSLPDAKRLNFALQPYNNLKLRFPKLSEAGFDLLNRMLTYDPNKRITAADALLHPYFAESPRAQRPEMMPTFPSGQEGQKRSRAAASPPRATTAASALEAAGDAKVSRVRY